MGAAAVAHVSESQLPQPENTKLSATEQVAEIVESEALSFDPEKLKKKYDEERDKRLRHGRGIEQYVPVEGVFEHYLQDPWAKPGFTRDPIEEDVEVVVIGGGYGAQLVAARLLEKGVKKIRIIEKAGDFGGTWLAVSR